MITIPQRRRNRAQLESQPVILHPRLERLNLELQKERTKSFDHLYITRQGVRIRVCAMRDEDGKYFATAQLYKAYKSLGGGPSGSVYMLSISLSVALAQMTAADRNELRRRSQEVGYV